MDIVTIEWERKVEGIRVIQFGILQTVFSKNRLTKIDFLLIFLC